MDVITVLVDQDLEPIIPRYFELQRRGLEKLDLAVAAKDADSVRLVGHKMKGTGSSYGFPYLTELGSAIEIAAMDGDLNKAAALARTAVDYLDRVNVVYGEVAS